MMKVSVIMPAYNAGLYIAESINSVLEQTYQNWELIVVDDGSTDNTQEIVKDFAAKDDRILYTKQQNGRQGKARNKGIEMSKGDVLAFLDADDLWLPQKLQTQIEELSGRNIDLVFSDSFVFKTELSSTAKKMSIVPGALTGEEGLHAMLERNRIPLLTVLVKKEAVLKVGCFEEDPKIQNAEDYHLWLKLLMAGYSFYGSEKVLAAYREHEQAVTSEDKLSSAKAIEALKALSHQFPAYKNILRFYLRRWFVTYHYSKHNWQKAEYQTLLRNTCKDIQRNHYRPFLSVLHSVFGWRITRKVFSQLAKV